MLLIYMWFLNACTLPVLDIASARQQAVCVYIMQTNVAVVIAAFKDGLQSQGFDFAAAPDTPAARNINVVG
jgi:lipopolysaccharide biosynthesis protein